MNRIIISLLIIFRFTLMGFSQDANPSTLINADNKVNHDSFSSLKAVLIVGPQEDGTASAIESMNTMAALFKSHGVKVLCFYNKNADWNKIKEASKEANFFVYSGHGSTMGEGGKTGGLCLTSMISSKEIINELKLKNNAVVIFKSVCGGAGSSADDNGDIGINEALQRVTDYAQPFFRIGASCYFANNVEDGCLLFLNKFFSGNGVGDCFKESTKTATLTTITNGVKTVEQIVPEGTKIEVSKEFRYDKNKQISIASSDWGGTVTRTSYTNGVKKVEQIPSSKDYDIAYVANPDFTINDLMK
jgi:hypothetical protein